MPHAAAQRIKTNELARCTPVSPRGPIPRFNVVIDLSHHNGKADIASVENGGTPEVIHKATQAWKYVDSMYPNNRDHAIPTGLLWFAYHFGVRADGVAQEDFFLSTAQPDKNTSQDNRVKCPAVGVESREVRRGQET
jgi:GH25 family lysozyme M1 (1,4-beta-N-acetylmuramidase)